ncbi:MAG TPA: FAD-dependent oxidoreductase, partial [Acidimicrobiales bacterium]|nr:FAD-dependent oxidoreductase [Acidimicrobiales bacterium]
MGARRIVVVGGVAGGMSAATRLRRLDEEASIVVLERSGHVSYANCGLPYFVGGVIEDEDDLLLQTPERLFDRFRLDVRVGTEVVAISPADHSVTVRATGDGATWELPYDALVLSPGAAPVRPPLPGFDRVRVLRTVEDAEILADQARGKPLTAVVIGAGFVGLETAENLAQRGIETTVVEAADQVLTPLDPELAVLVAAELVAHGVAIETGVGVAEVTDAGVVLADGRAIPGDLVVAAIGVRPDARLAEMAGLALGPHGGIAVDDDGRTSAADVYAVGDAVEKADSVGGGSSLIALANIANRQGRRVADAICGRTVRPAPSQGTAIVKVFGVTAAMTGWNERRLRAAKRHYRVIHS